jgi:hypothetical protein
MKNLLEYNEWLRAKFAIWKGETCEILSSDLESVQLKTIAGKVTVSKGDPDLLPINDEDQLIPFLQISAPTIAF